MSQPVEENLLLKKAKEDLTVFEKLLSDSSISDEILGFHAQQAIEKSLKAVLNSLGSKYPKTHDLNELLRMLDEAKVARPISDEELDIFTPYATSLRYEDSSDLLFDRAQTLVRLKKMIAWAERQISTPRGDSNPA